VYLCRTHDTGRSKHSGVVQVVNDVEFKVVVLSTSNERSVNSIDEDTTVKLVSNG
jgi:hypothetical protein